MAAPAVVSVQAGGGQRRSQLRTHVRLGGEPTGPAAAPSPGRPAPVGTIGGISMRSYLRAPRALALAVLLIGGAAPLAGGMAQPAFASNTYTWSVTCSGGGSCSVSWNWTQNGTVIPNPSSGSVVYNSGLDCVGICSVSSSNFPTTQFVQPDAANGITAAAQACVPASGGSKCNTQTTTQSFTPGSHVSISLTASVDAHAQGNCFPGYPCHGNGGTEVTESAAPKLNS